MKAKIQAGAEFDFLTSGELRKELNDARLSWRDEVSRGVRFRRFSFVGVADGAGLLAAGGAGSDPTGPDQGMAWRLLRLSVTNYDPAVNALGLFNGAAGGSSVIVPKLATYTTQMDEVLMPGDTLVVAGTVVAGARVWVTGQVKEAPVSLLWRL